MALQILNAGVFSSVQDAGRSGYRKYGIPFGGAADKYSYQVTNYAVGNFTGEATIEIIGHGFSFEVLEPCIISIGGADALWLGKQPQHSHYGDEPIPLNRPVLLQAGTLVRCAEQRRGYRSYLAIAGGWDIPTVMGSTGTFFMAKIGGYCGRLLQKYDILLPKVDQQNVIHHIHWKGASFGATVNWFFVSPIIQALQKEYILCKLIPDTNAIQRYQQHDTQSFFFRQQWNIGSQSNRMGIKLESSYSLKNIFEEQISSAVIPGTVQIPPDGKPIILHVDAQTVGGYPVLGYVAGNDLDVLAQAKPHTTINFTVISHKQSIVQLQKRQRYLQQLQTAFIKRYPDWHKHCNTFTHRHTTDNN